MNDHLRFRLEREPAPAERGVLSVAGSEWFRELLARVPGLRLSAKRCQEDWGVVVFAERDGKRFWIGLAWWPEGEGEWVAHLHPHSFAWVQRFTRSGKRALAQLIEDVADVLRADPRVADVVCCVASELGG